MSIQYKVTHFVTEKLKYVFTHNILEIKMEKHAWNIRNTSDAFLGRVVSYTPILISLSFKAWNGLVYVCLPGMTCTETLESLKCILEHMGIHSDGYPHPVLQPHSLSCKKKKHPPQMNPSQYKNPYQYQCFLISFCFTWQKHEVFFSSQLHAEISVIFDILQQRELQFCLQ